MKQPIREEKYIWSRSYVYMCEKCGTEVRRYNRIADRYTILCEECRKARYKQRLIDNDAKHDEEIREDERRKFTEWLVNKSAYTHIEYGKIGYQSDSDCCEMCWKSVDEVLAEYEKEQKKVKSDGDNCTVGND